MNGINLQNINYVWKRMNGVTWFSDNSEFTLIINVLVIYIYI